MTNLLVHPSRGARDGRENLQRSLAITVDFRDPSYGLDPSDVDELLLRHPSGRARFWGTYAHNQRKIQRVHEGDAVLFTGGGIGVWAVGVVGYRFESEPFASELWNTHHEKGVYRHMYSLARFEEIEIPYAAVNAPLGNRDTNHFQQMAVYSGERARAVIDVLSLDSALGEVGYAGRDTELARRIEERTAVRIPIEVSRTPISRVHIAGGERVIRRGEALLVQAYAASLGHANHGRTPSSAGMPDIEVTHPDGTLELLEAKSDVSVACVRAVLAQLLHYASAAVRPPHVVSGLFPEEPPRDLVAFLNRFGVDVVFMTGRCKFHRIPARDEARARLREVWS